MDRLVHGQIGFERVQQPRMWFARPYYVRQSPCRCVSLQVEPLPPHFARSSRDGVRRLISREDFHQSIFSELIVPRDPPIPSAPPQCTNESSYPRQGTANRLCGGSTLMRRKHSSRTTTGFRRDAFSQSQGFERQSIHNLHLGLDLLP